MRELWMRLLDALGIRSSTRPVVLTGWIEYLDDRRVGHALVNSVFTRCGRRARSSYSRAALDGPIVSCPACVAAGAR